jgi:hypothetical protein
VCGNSFPQAEHVNVHWLMFNLQAECLVYFEKLATAAVSVLQTSKTVTSLVSCRSSLNFLPRLLSLSVAPWVFALTCNATNIPSPVLSIYSTWLIFNQSTQLLSLCGDSSVSLQTRAIEFSVVFGTVQARTVLLQLQASTRK